MKELVGKLSSFIESKFIFATVYLSTDDASVCSSLIVCVMFGSMRALVAVRGAIRLKEAIDLSSMTKRESHRTRILHGN